MFFCIWGEKMQEFRITKIGAGAWSILDAGDSSFYLVEGTQRAAVIDTGISPGKQIVPVLRSLTSLPLVLVLTHAHIDHMHHMDEFEEVYLCHKEMTLPAEILQEHMGGKRLDLERTINIGSESKIELGKEVLEVCEVGGHTPGSVAFWAQGHNLLFTGDAIGSGYGVWMQVPGALSIERYHNNLRVFLKWLVDRGGRMQFWGGHSYQQFQSSLIPGYNPLNMGLLADLIDLTDGLITGKIVGRPSNADKIMTPEPALYASFGRAEIQYLPSRVRG